MCDVGLDDDVVYVFVILVVCIFMEYGNSRCVVVCFVEFLMESVGFVMFGNVGLDEIYDMMCD